MEQQEFNIERASCPIDEASNTEQRFLEQSLESARLKAKNKRVPVDPGYCDVCGDDVDNPNQLFCSVECRTKDEQREKLAAITGVRRGH